MNRHSKNRAQGRGGAASRARKVLLGSVLVLALVGVGLLAIPGIVQLGDDGALGLAIPGIVQLGDDGAPRSTSTGVDPGWEFAAPDDPSLGGAAPGPYAALDPSSPQGTESIREIDDSWLEELDVTTEEGDGSTLACIIEPSQVVEVGSSVTGLIEKIHVERSDVIEAGQALVELESRAERAAVELARAEARMDEQVKSREASALLGRRRRGRVQRLYDEKTLSLDLRQEIETDAELAELELERARADKRLAYLQLDRAIAVLDRRTIRSPIDGVVVERLMSPGERVDEDPILKVAQIDPLRVEVILPSSMFGSVAAGMRAAVVPEFPGDKVHVAVVTIVDRVIDAASGTFGVRLELPNPGGDIPSGLHCRAQFLAESSE